MMIILKNICSCFLKKSLFAVAVIWKRNWMWNKNRTRSGITNKISCNKILHRETQSKGWL